MPLFDSGDSSASRGDVVGLLPKQASKVPPVDALEVVRQNLMVVETPFGFTVPLSLAPVLLMLVAAVVVTEGEEIEDEFVVKSLIAPKMSSPSWVPKIWK